MKTHKAIKTLKVKTVVHSCTPTTFDQSLTDLYNLKHRAGKSGQLNLYDDIFCIIGMSNYNIQ